ncbi:MBL fold metallo-hydrolase [Actinomadura sp. J1-007]|nr:MBL fold metallo-hydrolase [Actinomadura sp. J1-007]
MTPPDGSVTFVGNATVIIRYGGFTLLTDPNFLHKGQHAYLGYGLRSRRLKEPALSVEQLPDLDAVVLSHLHDDHWDRVAERGLDRALPVLTTEAAARALDKRGFRGARALRTWQHTEITKDGRRLRLTAMPGRHGPGPLRHLLPPVMGSLLEFGPRDAEPEFRLYISGDTLMYEGLAEVARRHPEIDTGIVHLGGTRLLGVLTVTMDGRQGARWMETIPCRSVLPVHYDDYTVQKSPLSAFRTEVERRGMSARLRHIDRGQTLTL